MKTGTTTVTVSGKEEYTGSVQKTFQILPASLEAVAVAAVEDLTYTGQPLKPELTVTFGSDGVPVVKEQDYTVTYEKNTAAGTADVTLTAAADGNFTGTKKVTFKIVPAAFSDDTVTCEMKDKLEYTGEPVTQETLKLTFGGQELVKDTDYTVTYSNNLHVGKAAMTITGQGNFSGSIEKSFEIVVYGSRPALTDGKGSILLEKKEYLHTGSEITPAVTVTYDGKTLTENLDYTVAYENNKDAGTAKVLVTGMNRYSGTLTETFLITKPIEEGWQQTDKGWWYQYADGTYPKSEWKQIEGKWYYFGPDGYMKKGWLSTGSKWYYLNGDGSMVSGTWKQLNGKWYYFTEDGSMAANTWKQLQDKWYYFTEDGSMAADEWVDNEQYYIDAEGHWVQDQVKV